MVFDSDDSGETISGTLNGTSAFYHVQFSDPSGSDATWTIQDAMLVDGTDSGGNETNDTFVIDNGTVTVGDGDGDDLGIIGVTRIADTAGETGSLLTYAALDQTLSEEIIIDIGNNTPALCETGGGSDSCIIYVGATGGGGTGTLDIAKNVRLRLNPFDDGGAGADSDAGIEVQSTGYLEIQGSQDDTGTVTQSGTIAKRSTHICSAAVYTADEHNNKVVRITNASSLAFGRIYDITDTLVDDSTNCTTGTHDSLVIADESTADDTDGITVVDNSDGSWDVTINNGIVTTNDEHIGRYLRNLTDDSYYLIVDSDSTADTVTIIADPDDPGVDLTSMDNVDISDGIRHSPADTFEVLDYALVQAEANACDRANTGNGEAYIRSDSGSETFIRYADICDLGRNDGTTDHYGLIVESGDGANANEGFSVERSRIHAGYRGVILNSTDNHNGAAGSEESGVRDNAIYDNEDVGLVVTGGSKFNIIDQNHIFDNGASVSGVSVTGAGVTLGNTLSGNHVYRSGTFGLFVGEGPNYLVSNVVYANLDGSYVPNRGTAVGNKVFGNTSDGFIADGTNAIVAGNTVAGNQANGLLISTGEDGYVLGGNTFYANGSEAIQVNNNADNHILFANAIYGNASGGLFLNDTDSIGNISIKDTFGSPHDNGTEDIDFVTATGVHNLTLFNTLLGSATEVADADAANAFILSRRHDQTGGLVHVWNDYTVPNNDAETPQDDGLVQVNYADGLWPDSISDPGYSGTGTQDTDIEIDFSSAMAGTDDVVAYRIVCKDDATADCDSTVTTTNAWDVLRYGESGTETDVGDVDLNELFTDGTTNVQFRLCGGLSLTPACGAGSGTAYATGDTYIFVAWKADTNTNTQKTLEFQQDSDTLTVGTGETLEIKGDTSTQANCDDSARRTIVRHVAASGEGYSIAATGSVDLQCADFDEMGGTGQSVGLDIQSGGTVTSLDNTSWDNFAVNVGASDTYIQIANSVIDAGQQLLEGLVFDDNGDGADSNVNFNITKTAGTPSACSDAWRIESSGNIGGTTAGEANDSDDGDGGGCNGGSGYLLWLADAALSTSIVDGNGEVVTSPSVAFSSTTLDFACQTTTGTLGTASERIQVTNGTASAQWDLQMSATSGAGTRWTDGGTNEYDFNDGSGAPAGCADGGGDADDDAGQLTVDPSGATITALNSCTTTGLSLGASDVFNEGVTDSIDIVTAGATADTNCIWDFTGVSLSQQIPAEQAIATYNIDMTLTVTAI